MFAARGIFVTWSSSLANANYGRSWMKTLRSIANLTVGRVCVDVSTHTHFLTVQLMEDSRCALRLKLKPKDELFTGF